MKAKMLFVLISLLLSFGAISEEFVDFSWDSSSQLVGDEYVVYRFSYQITTPEPYFVFYGLTRDKGMDTSELGYPMELGNIDVWVDGQLAQVDPQASYNYGSGLFLRLTDPSIPQMGSTIKVVLRGVRNSDRAGLHNWYWIRTANSAGWALDEVTDPEPIVLNNEESSGLRLLQGDNTEGSFYYVCEDHLTTQACEAKSEAFVLNQHAWLDIQKYVATIKALPDDETSMREQFEIPTDEPFGDYQRILEDYQAIEKTTKQWEDILYPSIIEFATDIYNNSDEHLKVTDRMTQIAFDTKSIIDALEKVNLNISIYEQIGVPIPPMLLKERASFEDEIDPILDEIIEQLRILENDAKANIVKIESIENEVFEFIASVKAETDSLQQCEKENYILLKQYEDGNKVIIDEYAQEMVNLTKLEKAYKHCATVLSDNAPEGKSLAVTIFTLGINRAVYSLSDVLMKKKCEEGIDEHTRKTKERIAKLKSSSDHEKSIIIGFKNASESMLSISATLTAVLPDLAKIGSAWQDIALAYGEVRQQILFIKDTYDTRLLGEFTAIYSTESNVADINRKWQNMRNEAVEFLNYAYLPMH